MNQIEKGRKSLFASQSLREHLLRGVIATLLLIWAIRVHIELPVLSVFAGLGALLAFRGCPMCWTMGLIETVLAKYQR